MNNVPVFSLLTDVLEALGAEYLNGDRVPTVSNTTLTELGEALAQRVGHEPPWSARYLRGILNETITPPKKPNAPLTVALTMIAQEIDGTPVGLAGAIEVSVFVPAHLAEALQHALIMKPSIKCARPACFVKYIPNSPNQKYHIAACRLLHYKEKRKDSKA